MARAQGAPVLTWEQAVREAQLNNPELAAAREAVAQGRAGVQQARAPFLPSVSATADAASSGAGDPVEGAADSYGLGVSVRQDLYAGGRDRAALAQARAGLAAAEARLQRAASDVAFRLDSAFSDLLFAQEQTALAAVIAERRKSNVRLVGLRFEAGRENKGAFLRIQAAASQARFEMAQAQRRLRTSQRELAAALGRPRFEPLAATGTLAGLAPETAPDFESLATALPAVVEARAQARSAAAGVDAAEGLSHPSLVASAGASRSGGDWPPDSRRWSAGLGLSLPLFTGGANTARQRSARASERAARAQLASVEQGAAADLESAFAAFQDASQRTAVQGEFLEAAELRAEIGRSQYSNGLLSFEDWDLIENDLINTRKAHLASRREAAVARAAWDRALGGGPLR